MVLFTFSHPQYLFFLIVIPLVFFIHFFSLGNKKKKALKFANFDAIARIEGIDFFSKNVILLTLSVLALAALVFAISGLTLHTTAESTDFSFVLAIDSSKSMEATDLSPNRISVAKDTASDFVSNSPLDTRFGVISFAGSSKIEIDMTDRKGEIKSAIGGIKLTDFGGTDLYEAVLTGSNLLQEENAKAIVLLSDGQINVGTVDEAVGYATRHDVIVHTIAVGTREGGATEFGFSRLDEDSLRGIAYETGGVFFNTTNKQEIESALSEIFGYTEKKVSIELFDYLVIFAIVVLLLEFFLSNTRYGSLF